MKKLDLKMGERGLTMVEVIVAAAIFLVFALGVYRGFDTLRIAINQARYRALAADLANARFEIIKNLPYSEVGTIGGDPAGVIEVGEEALSDGVSFFVTTTVVNVDDPFDGTETTGDIFPDDYKLVELSITCDTCRSFTPVKITGLVAPANLEGI